VIVCDQRFGMALTRPMYERLYILIFPKTWSRITRKRVGQGVMASEVMPPIIFHESDVISLRHKVELSSPI